MPKPLDVVVVEQRIDNQKLNVCRLTFVLVPLVVCAACLFTSIYSINIPDALRVIGAFLYFMWCAGTKHAFESNGSRLTGDIDRMIRNEIAFFKSPELPKNPPLCNGFIYAKKIGAEYSEPFELKFSLSGTRVFGAYQTEYSSKISLAGKDYNYHCYDGENLDRFKLNALRDFESGGYEVNAIKNEFGQYLWVKGDYFKHGKFYKNLLIAKLNLIKVLIFVSMLIPLIFMLRPLYFGDGSMSLDEIDYLSD